MSKKRTLAFKFLYKAMDFIIKLGLDILKDILSFLYRKIQTRIKSILHVLTRKILKIRIRTRTLFV